MSKPRGKGKPFEKGHSLSKGRTPMTTHEKKVARLTRARFKRIARDYLHKDKDELKRIAARKGTPALDLIVISVLSKAITTGDQKRLEWFMDQIFGKPVEEKEIKHTGTIGNGSVDMSKLTDQQLQVLNDIHEIKEEN